MTKENKNMENNTEEEKDNEQTLPEEKTKKKDKKIKKEKNKINNKTLMIICGITIFLTLFSMLFSQLNTNRQVAADNITDASSLLEQKVIGLNATPQLQYHLYVDNEKIGILHNYNAVQGMLDTLYKEKYEEEFPNSSISFANDVLIIPEMSYNIYENIDEKIMSFLVDNALIAFEVYKITFSNGEVAYIKNLDDFEVAKEQYVLNFIDSNSYEALKANIIPNAVIENGENVVYRNIEIQETAKITKDYGPAEKILDSVEAIVGFLSYGYNVERTYYNVEEGDTVQWIALKHQLTTTHFMLINPDIIDQHQLLEVGSQVEVTYFQSPINILVQREVTRQEVINEPPVQYVTDANLAEGREEWVAYGSKGSKEVTYKEVYSNGRIVENEVALLSTKVLVDATQPIKKRGTKYIAGYGTGSFIRPLDNMTASCGWLCYSGHYALDLQNRYNRNGPIYAMDRGTVVTSTWHYSYGYYVVIDHQNGYKTLYAHMVRQPNIPAGVAVEKGEVIGYVGNTGNSYGAHLHLEVYKDGARINPSLVMQ